MLPNPRQMEAAMRKLGIKSNQVEASRVVIEKVDGSKIVIENPSVTEIDMGGQKSFQVAGQVSEEASNKSKDADVQLIIDQTGSSKEDAERALEECGGDIAEAIEKLAG